MSNTDELEVKVHIERGDQEIEVEVLVMRYGHHDPDFEYEYNEESFSSDQCKEIEERALNAYLDYYDKNPGEDPEIERGDHLYYQWKEMDTGL